MQHSQVSGEAPADQTVDHLPRALPHPLLTCLPHLPATTKAALPLIIPGPPLANLHPIALQLYMRLHYTAHTEEQREANKCLTGVLWEVRVVPTPTLLL